MVNDYYKICGAIDSIRFLEKETQINQYENIFSLFVVPFILYLILVVLTFHKIRTFSFFKESQ